MKAELIAVGSELLLFGRRDTNGDWLAEQLSERGFSVGRRTVVADDAAEIAGTLTDGRHRARLVVVTGGLGPTKDDLTREAMAMSLGRPLVVDPGIRERLEEAMRARGMASLAAAETQARVPEGCEPLANPLGSAPGLLHSGPPCWTVVLPGVPGEMRAMFDLHMGRLSEALPARPVPRERLLIAGLWESEVDARLRDLIGLGETAIVTILAGEGGVEILVAGTGECPGDLAAREVDRIVSEVRSRLGGAVVGQGRVTLAETVGELLRSSGGCLAVAESCTGGRLGGEITEVAGSSDWFSGGWITYSDALKRDLLGVPEELLERHGAVSSEVAASMADGARARSGASHALAVTGIAGPSGGSEDKPVGLVYVSLASPRGTRTKRFRLSGNRTTVRSRSVAIALDLLRRDLLGDGA